MMKRLLLIVAALTLVAGRANATTYTVCASGCDFTKTTWQTGLNAAVEGDTFKLKAGELFTGHWSLPDKNMTGAGITITSDTSAANLPAAGARATMAHTPFMPILQSDTTSDPVIRTAAGSTSAAERYTFIGVWFKSNPSGYGDVVWLGGNDCDFPGFCQEFASQEPDRVTIDRCVFTADPVTGQKRFVSLGGTNLIVENSSFFGAAGLGQDSQAIGGMNGHGPWTITNNYLEAAAENFMAGGDDARERTVMTVTGSATTTGAAVSVAVGNISTVPHSLAELTVGDHLAILVSGGTARCHTILRSKSGSGTTGTITFDMCAAAPDVPGDIRTGVTPAGLTITRNHFTKPLAWLNPIINAPTSVSVAPSTSSGTLAAGTYTYSVLALNTGGYQAQTEFSSAQSVTCTLSATGHCTFTWAQTTNASHYRVYGRVAGTVSMYFQLANGSCAAGSCTIDDTGAAGTAASSVPGPSYWQIKNLIEIKAAQNALIEGNVFENCWTGSDNGSCGGWFKTTNQNGNAEFVWSKDITVQHNIIRHVDGCFAVSGAESPNFAAADAPAPLTNFTYRHNLCYDSGGQWSLSKGGTSETRYAMMIGNGSVNAKIDHNTFIHTAKGFVYITSGTHTGFVLTNNLGFKNTYGFFCEGFAEGTATCQRTPAITASANVIAGISTSLYPGGNFGPSVATFQAQFTNYTADGSTNTNGATNYQLLTTSVYHNAATDSTDIGADIAAVLSATSGVTSGSVATVSNPPAFTTTNLPRGTVNSAYTGSVAAQGTGAITFSLFSGTLPSGIVLDPTGAFTGTPTLAGTSTITIRATDAGTGLTADTTPPLSITIDPALVTASITTASPLPDAVLGQAYTPVTIAVSGGKPPNVWSVSAGALPAGMTLDATTGAISGVPSETGTFSATARVAGAIGTPATKTLGLTVRNETMPAGRVRSYNKFFESSTFIRPACPTTGIRKGDLCSDISGAAAKLRIAGTATPSVRWDDVSAQLSSHNLLSATHLDTVVDTPQDGDLVVYTAGTWRRFPLCAQGTVIGSDGTALTCVPVAQQTAQSQSTPTPYMLHTRVGSSSSWTQPLALTELFGGVGNRALANLTNKTQAWLYVRVSSQGVSGAQIWAQYSADEVTWADLDSAGTAVVTLNPAGNKTVGPFAIASAARGRVYLRIVGTGGDGMTIPTLGNIEVLVE
jgi:hypothetical protein